MELFMQTLTIMAVGMALVFFFIFIVIQCMNFTAFMIRRYAASHPGQAETAPDLAANTRMVAAIAAAIECNTEKA